MILRISNSCKGGVKEELSPERDKIYFGRNYSSDIIAQEKLRSNVKIFIY